MARTERRARRRVAARRQAERLACGREDAAVPRLDGALRRARGRAAFDRPSARCSAPPTRRRATASRSPRSTAHIGQPAVALASQTLDARMAFLFEGGCVDLDHRDDVRLRGRQRLRAAGSAEGADGAGDAHARRNRRRARRGAAATPSPRSPTSISRSRRRRRSRTIRCSAPKDMPALLAPVTIKAPDGRVSASRCCCRIRS